MPLVTALVLADGMLLYYSNYLIFYKTTVVSTVVYNKSTEKYTRNPKNIQVY